MTIRELQKKYLPLLAPEDFFVLLMQATEKEKTFLLAHPEYSLSAEEEKKAIHFMKRCQAYEPVAYITGHKEFYGREFHVTSDTLIPRPETELFIESVLDTLAQTDKSLTPRNIDIVDVGTGSGNIIITLAKEIEAMHLTSNIHYSALDISSSALTIAMKNAVYHKVAKKILFLESNLLQRLSFADTNNHHLIITANLPYLSTALYHSTEPNVKNYEPISALESGHDGLDHYRRLLQELKTLSLSVPITLFLEISPEQTQLLTEEILAVFPGMTLVVLQDFSGRDRLIQATLLKNTKTPYIRGFLF